MTYYFYKSDRFIEKRFFLSSKQAKSHLIKKGYDYFFDSNNIYYD